MKKILLVIALIATGGAAAAADVTALYKAPAKLPVYDWTGGYVGAHLGYGLGRTASSVTTLPSPSSFNETPFSIGLNPQGALGGFQLGYNWQVNRSIFGVETDLSYSGVRGEGTSAPIFSLAPTPVPGSYQNNSQRMEWFATIRARAGVRVVDNFLLFATGGAAFGVVKYDALQFLAAPAANQFAAGSRVTKTGWTIGAGGEWAFAQNWSAKAEYLYYDLGSETLTADRVGPVPFVDPFKVVSNFGTDGHIVRIGVNYQLR